MAKKFTLETALQKVSVDILYHEYIELNQNAPDVTKRYNLSDTEWTLLKKEYPELRKSKYLSSSKSNVKGIITREKNRKFPSCRVFIQQHKEEIQKFADEGKSILDIFYYYQDNYTLTWHDYGTFFVWVKNTGITYTEENSKKIFQEGRRKTAEALLNKTPEERTQIYAKYKHTLDTMPKEKKQEYIARRINTKANYTKEQKEHLAQTALATRIKNNSFGKSKIEAAICTSIEEIYPKVLKQYMDKSRYPFACDIYIPELDLFIEVNGHWTHQNHPFIPNSAADLEKLEILKSRQDYYINQKGNLQKNSYFIAENVWIKKDPLKLYHAKIHNLNYLALYNLSDKNVYNIEKIDLKSLRGIHVIDMDTLTPLEYYINMEIEHDT